MTYLVRKGVKYGDMLRAIVEHEVGWQDGDDEEEVNVELASVWKTESMRTALFRALVANVDGDYGEEDIEWSSCNQPPDPHNSEPTCKGGALMLLETLIIAAWCYAGYKLATRKGN